ncbi:MAG: VTT domain-containing protein [bacterium]|nr:VTT domain-containing protein [bacterium]
MVRFGFKNLGNEKLHKLYEIVKILLVILVLYLVLGLLIPILTSQDFRRFVQSLGPAAPLIVILYIVISHVFAPLAGTPGVLLGVAVFGIYQTMFYLYLASAVSAAINFYISRRFGRKWVIRLVGEKTMAEINDFVGVFGTQILILSRLFGFAIFEVISYAAGLTNIDFRKYFLITLVFSSVSNLVFAFLFRDVDFSSGNSLILWLGILLVSGLIFSLFIKKYLSKRKPN